MTDSSAKLRVFYDGACPLCRRERARYERMAKAAGDAVDWFDINGREDELRRLGIDPHLALTELHVEDEQRRIHRELDAYILLMKRVPRLRPIAWLIGLPLVRPLLARLYHRSVTRRLKRQGRL